MQKIFFHSSPFSIAKTSGGGGLLNGCIYPSASSISDLKASFNQTGNKGNMVHSEAPMKLFKHNLSRSCVGNLVHAHQSMKDNFSKYMKSNFDLAILSMANFIRKNQDHAKLVEALKQLEIPIIIFSAGLQGRLNNINDLSESTIELLRILDSKALFFSVRGGETSKFLKSIGFVNHIICGCPSLYVYPKNILSIKPVSYRSNLLLSTAGHFSTENLTLKTSKSARAKELVRLFKSIEADYTFQDEVFSYKEILDDHDCFDDARQRFYPGVISNYLAKFCDTSVSIKNWYYFNDVASWRLYMAGRDIYIGDRFHGGVVALQSSTPAIIIKGDLRVQELTDFFSLPSANFSDFRDFGIETVINDKLSSQNITKFQETYISRLKEFQSSCTSVGLEFS